jgi:hypothetical protein
MARLVARFECRCADCFTFSAVRCCQAVCLHVAIGAIEVRKIGGGLVTQCQLLGRKTPAGFRVIADLR